VGPRRRRVPEDPGELAAIVAAVEMCWPRPGGADEERPDEPPPWRFSGRWWAAPLPLRRARPGS
jgi:hypothetical protein